MEEEDLEFEHFEDCFMIASNLQSEHKYEEALEVIKDSGLDLNFYHQLEEIKLNSLMNLRQIQPALECLENSCIQVVQELIKNLKLKEALHQIAKSKLDLKSHPKLLELQVFCLRTLEEIPLVRELIKEVFKYYNVKDYEKALELIDTCRFDLKVHLNLLETKAYCLKKLGRDKGNFL